MRRTRLTLFAAAIAGTLVACGARAPEVPPIKPVQVGDLVGSQWVAEDISGGGVIDNSHSTIHFVAVNQVDGNTSCNLFRGPLATEGQTIQIGPLATTRRACPPVLMDQERRYLMALARADGWRLDGELLVFLDDGGQILVRYARIDPTAIPVRP